MTKENEILGCIDISSLIKAIGTFKKGLKSAKTELERDGVIQRFEFTYELVWKTLKRILKFKGLEFSSPRDVFRESAKQGLINNIEIWFKFIKKRNLTVHTYNADCANEIFKSLPTFEKELDEFLNLIKEL